MDVRDSPRALDALDQLRCEEIKVGVPLTARVGFLDSGTPVVGVAKSVPWRRITFIATLAAKVGTR